MKEMAPGYEMGPLGVPVFKDAQSGSRRGPNAGREEVLLSCTIEQRRYALFPLMEDIVLGRIFIFCSSMF